MIAWRVVAKARHRLDDMEPWKKAEIIRTAVTVRDDPSSVMAIVRRCYGHNVGEYRGRQTGTRAVDRILSIERLGEACVEGKPNE